MREQAPDLAGDSIFEAYNQLIGAVDCSGCIHDNYAPYRNPIDMLCCLFYRSSSKQLRQLIEVIIKHPEQYGVSKADIDDLLPKGVDNIIDDDKFIC